MRDVKFLKERYRVGKKRNREYHRFTKSLHCLMMISWRSQLYIKLTRSNDDGSRKHLLKYFSLKFHIIFMMRNKWYNFAFGVYRSVRVLCIYVLASMQCKMFNRFFTVHSRPEWPIDLKLLQVCQFMYMMDYISAYNASKNFWLAKLIL